MSGYENLIEELASKEKAEYSVKNARSPERLNGRYTLGRCIGIGGLSKVYEAIDAYAEHFQDNRKLAVKLPSELLLQKKDVDAFMYAEYSHLLQLSHPGIVQVIDFGVDPALKVPYIVLEHLQGRLLSEMPFSEFDNAQKKKLLASMFSIIEYLNAQGIVHADINPTNIMCLDDGTFRLFDFGISVNQRKQQAFELNYKKIRAFNPLYAAPEILEGAGPDRKSDLFSLAVVLFELYSGRLPYTKRAVELRDKPLSRRDLNALPLRLRCWFRDALKADAAKRPEKIPSMLRLHGRHRCQ